MHETRQHTRWAALALLVLTGCGQATSEPGGEQATNQELTSGPDFLVKEVSRPANVRPGMPLETTLTVCNAGQQPGPVVVKLYASADEQLSEPEDTWLTNVHFDQVWPGRCVRRTVRTPAAVQEGTWRLGARISDGWAGGPDADPSNDLRFSAPFGVGQRPDFVVRALEAPSSVRPGQFVRTQATVCNEGTEYGSVQVHLMVSADEVLTEPGSSGPAQDFFVASRPLHLDAGQCAPVLLEGSVYEPPSGAPPPSGTPLYYLGVLASPTSSGPEFNTANNGKAQRLGWGQGPDFVVTSVRGPTAVRPYAPLNAEATVCNQGTDAGRPELNFYLSDAPLAPQPPAPGGPTREVLLSASNAPLWLMPEQCATVPLRSWANWQSDSWQPKPLWLGARVVDTSGGELRPDNNTFAGTSLILGEGPDLVITAVKGPAAVEPSRSFGAEVTVCNQGTWTAHGVGPVSVWLSEDGFALESALPGGPEEPFAGYADPRTTLEPGQCLPVPVQVQAQVPAYFLTEYVLRARVDSSLPELELRRDNNAHPGYRLGVGFGPDFVVTALQAPPSARQGERLRAQVTVCNQGTQPGSTDGVVLLSLDETFQVPGPYTLGDQVVGSYSTGPLEPGQCTTRPVEGQVSPLPPPGPFYGFTYHLGTVVNPSRAPSELLLNNNTLGRLLRVGEGADFVVTAVSGPPSVRFGQDFTAQVTVCNQGTLAAGTDVRLHLTADARLSAPVPPSGGPGGGTDGGVGMSPVPTLAPGQCSTLPIRGTAQPPPYSSPDLRAYYLGAVVNPTAGTSELDLSNNVHVSERIGVGDDADFVITAVTGPANVRPGDALTARVTVCNQGTQPASAPLVLLLSADERFQPPGEQWNPQGDVVLANTETGPLVPGQCTTLPLSGTAWPPGSPAQRTYHLGAVVNPMRGGYELRWDNNTHAGYLLGVGDGPDFVFTSMTNPGFVRVGEPLATQVRVCNQGTLLGEARVRVLLSADERLQAPGGSGPSGDALVAETPTGMLPPGVCTTLNLSAPAWPPPTSAPTSPPAVFHLGAVVESFSPSDELRTDNNDWHAGSLYLY